MDSLFSFRKKLMLVLGFSVIFTGQCGKQEEKMSYLDPSLPLEQRVVDLVGRMTLEEKISQMGHTAPAIERLLIPEYNWWNEALHGVARAGIATVFPQAIGLAATWNTELMGRVATVISDEGRAKHHEAARRGDRRIYRGLTFWSPNINIFRDPRWGRGMETYGEDPYLTGRMGVAFVKGLQGDDPKYLKTVSTPKHFAVHSGPEPERHSFNAVVSQSDFRQTYLPAFEACVVEGGAMSVMGAYNRTLGEPCCASPTLLTDILRKEWGFKGYVVSDCWAIRDIYQGHHVVSTAPEAAAAAVKAGCDLNCGNAFQDALLAAVNSGLLGEQDIDRAVGRLFEARFRLGLFDPPEIVPYDQIPYSANDSPEHRQLALQAARESMVLLKNERNLLPLSKDLKSVAVLGPLADDVNVLVGNYNGQPSEYTTLLEGIKRKLEPQARVSFTPACEPAENFANVVPVPSSALLAPEDAGGVHGLRIEYWNNPDHQGQPVRADIMKEINFNDYEWERVPEIIGADMHYSLRWTGKLLAPVSGSYSLGVRTPEKFRFYFDGELALGDSSSLSTPAGSKTAVSFRKELEAGSTHDIRLETFDSGKDTEIFFEWEVPVSGSIEQVIKQADLVILCLGLTPRLEGEEMDIDIPGFKGGDRTSLDLPGPQEKLLEKVAGLRKPVVLVLANGSALAINWADSNLPAILETWYSGEEGGNAVADVLFGDYNPGGRLPVTFYRSVDQLPPFEDYNMAGRTYRYFTGDPLYPFGHGLSYTKFAYTGLSVEPAEIVPGQNAVVSVEVQNAGSRAGDEVVQLYLTDRKASVPVPVRSLAGFKRVSLEPGQSTRVSFTLQGSQFSLIDAADNRVVEPGEFLVSVGGKQPGFSGTADAATTGTVSGMITVKEP